jgi:molybdopterin converting factor small subunit
MEITVEFSEYLAMKIGEKKKSVVIKTGDSISDLIHSLCLTYGKIVEDLFWIDKEKLAMIIFVNKQSKKRDYILQDKDHVIFFLPVMGG